MRSQPPTVDDPISEVSEGRWSPSVLYYNDQQPPHSGRMRCKSQLSFGHDPLLILIPSLGAGMAFNQFYASRLPKNTCTHYCLFGDSSTRCLYRVLHLVYQYCPYDWNLLYMQYLWRHFALDQCMVEL